MQSTSRSDVTSAPVLCLSGTFDMPPDTRTLVAVAKKIDTHLKETLATPSLSKTLEPPRIIKKPFERVPSIRPGLDYTKYPEIAAVNTAPHRGIRWESWCGLVERSDYPVTSGFDIVNFGQCLVVYPITRPVMNRAPDETLTSFIKLPWNDWIEIIKALRNPFPHGAQIISIGLNREVVSINFARM